jgi:glycosyltransferase involved in cell wall biosynthesis
MADTKHLTTVFSRHQENLSGRNFYEMLRTFLDQGYRIDCVCAEELKPPFKSEQLVLHRVAMPEKMREGLLFWLCFYFSALCSLFRILRREHERRVLVSRAHYSFLAFPVCFLLRTRIVLVLNSAPWEERAVVLRGFFKRTAFAAIDRLGISAASAIVVPSESLKSALVRKHPSWAYRTRVVPRSLMPLPEIARDEWGIVDDANWQEWLAEFHKRKRVLAEKYQLPEKWLYIAACGELATRKNLEVLVRAFSATENDRLALFLWGGNEERNFLQAMAVSLGLYDRLTFVDSSESLSEMLAGCDIVVQCSTVSGSATLLYEALGCGAGVLAVDSEENREILRQDALLFRPQHVQALVDKFHALGSVRGELQQIKKISQERAGEMNFAWGRVLADCLDKSAS